MYLQRWPDTEIVQEIIEGFWSALANVKFPDPSLGFERILIQAEGHWVPMQWGQSVVKRVRPPSPSLCQAGTETQAGQNVLDSGYILYLYFISKKTLENIPSNIYSSSTVDWCGDFGRQRVVNSTDFQCIPPLCFRGNAQSIVFFITHFSMKYVATLSCIFPLKYMAGIKFQIKGNYLTFCIVVVMLLK